MTQHTESSFNQLVNYQESLFPDIHHAVTGVRSNHGLLMHSFLDQIQINLSSTDITGTGVISKSGNMLLYRAPNSSGIFKCVGYFGAIWDLLTSDAQL